MRSRAPKLSKSTKRRPNQLLMSWNNWFGSHIYFAFIVRCSEFKGGNGKVAGHMPYAILVFDMVF